MPARESPGSRRWAAGQTVRGTRPEILCASSSAGSNAPVDRARGCPRRKMQGAMRAEAAGQLTAQQLQAGINAAQDADLPTIMRALTKKGRNLLGKLSHDEADEHGRTPLINAAAYTWDPDIVPYLISQGADVHAADAQGRTALHHVTSSNNTAAAARSRHGRSNLSILSAMRWPSITRLRAAQLRRPVVRLAPTRTPRTGRAPRRLPPPRRSGTRQFSRCSTGSLTLVEHRH